MLKFEVVPQNGKSSVVCVKCALKIRSPNTLFEFIRAALNCENTDEESNGEQRLKGKPVGRTAKTSFPSNK